MEQAFNMAATAEAFNILSSNLYSNPRLAIIRELSTNANDSSIASGTNTPFDLHLPTSEEQFFDIRDYGEGIPEEWIYNIYTSYFISTKTEDESQTGCFGLGSKTPFSLVDKYFVISYCDGKKITYKMEKKNGLPTVEKIEEEPWTKDTGLEIKFDLRGLQNWEYREWDTEAREFFKGTSFLPHINTIEQDPDFDWQTFAKQREFYSMDSIDIGYSYRPKITVNVAGVNFPVNIDDLKAKGNEVSSWFSEAGVAQINIMAGKSDVTLTPSREVLHYDDKTIDFIVNGVKKVIEEYYQKINDNFDNYNYVDAIKLNASQKYDTELNERISNKVFDLFFRKALIIRRSGRGAHVEVANPLNFSTGWRATPENYYFVDFNGIKTTVKQSVVDNFLALKTFDDKGKLTSTSFADVVKKFDPDSDYVVLFPKDYKNAENMEACKKFLGDAANYVKWADFCDIKKESSGRKLGFKTRSTINMEKGKGTTYGYGYGSNANPDLQDDEIGLIIDENQVDTINSKIRILNDLGVDYKISIRPCKESVFKKYKEKGFQTLAEYVDGLAKDHLDTIKAELTACRKLQALRNISWSFEQELFDVINDSAYDELLADENFKTLRELYTKENYDAEYHSSFDNITVEDVPTYSISFSRYPLYKKLNLSRAEDFRNFFDYVLLYRKSDLFQVEKKIEEEVA